MEQTKKKSKTGFIIGICVALSAVVMGGSILAPYLILKGNKNGVQLPRTKYASEYDLEDGKTARKVYRNWAVRKENNNGSKSLYVWYQGEKQNTQEYLTFRVFDSSSEAKKKYESMYESYQGYRGIDEEGENWFIGWEPYVCDASIYDMILLQDNVIIMAELDFVGEWAEPVPDENEPAATPEPTESRFNTMTLKDYLLNNAEDMRDYVLERILGY